MKGKKIKQGYSVKPLPAAGSEPVLSAKIGGTSNKPAPFKTYPKGK